MWQHSKRKEVTFVESHNTFIFLFFFKTCKPQILLPLFDVSTENIPLHCGKKVQNRYIQTFGDWANSNRKAVEFFFTSVFGFQIQSEKKPEIKTKETNTLSWNLIDKKLAPPPRLLFKFILPTGQNGLILVIGTS